MLINDFFSILLFTKMINKLFCKIRKWRFW
jgi:hypothetical protein